MPNPSVEILAWGRIGDQTEIQFAVCAGRIVELIIGGPEGLTLDLTERALLNLHDAVAGALEDFRATYGPVSAA